MRLWVWALGLCACGDDISLRIAVHHPDGVAVGLTKVTVYESATLTCNDVAFARIGGGELDAVKVTEQSVDASGEVDGALEGISRVDHKVIVARGYADNGTWITAGCAEQDVVDERTKIAIDTIPTVTAATVLDADPDDALLAVLATTDATGKAVSDRRTAWTVYGPAGSVPMSSSNVKPGTDEWEPEKATCTKAGAAALHPPPPNVSGGYAVQLRAEWAVELPALYSRFQASFGTKMFTPPTGSRKYCAIRKQGTTTGVVCIEQGLVARDYAVQLAGDGTVTLVQRQMVSLAVGSEPLSVVAVPNGADRDVYVVSKRGELTPLFGAAPAENGVLPCPDTSCEVADVMAVPPCDTLPGKLIVTLKPSTTGDTVLKQMNARGGGTREFPLGPLGATLQSATPQLDNAGCVTRADPNGGAPTLRQVVTYHLLTRNALSELVTGATRAAYGCTPTGCVYNELFPGAGVAFTTGSESRLLATFVDASGVVIAELVMAPDPDRNRDLFVERGRFPAAGPPDRMVAGNYDTDGETDVFWNISARRGTSFEIAYARKAGAQRLEALSGSLMISVIALDTGDLTGDGNDDVMMIGDITGSLMSGAVVIPMHVQAPVVAIPPDSACSP